MIARSSSFNNAFKQTAINNCDILIYDASNNLLLDKSKVSLVSSRLYQKYVCEQFLSEETTIEILNWDSLLPNARNYLKTKKNKLFVYYVVDNVQSTGARVMMINECKIAFDNHSATITCKHILQFATERALTFYFTANYPYEEVSNKDLLGYFLPYTFNTFTVDNVFNTVRIHNYEKAIAQIIQDLIVSSGGGLSITFDGTNFDGHLKSFINEKNDLSNYYELPLINVYDDIALETSPACTTQVIGYTTEAEQTIYSNGFYQASFAPTLTKQSSDISLLLDNSYISSVIITNSGGNTDADSIVYFMGIVAGTFSNVNAGGYDYVVKATKVNPPAITYTGIVNTLSISAPYVNDADATQKAVIKADADAYYALTDTISFSCRINPCIEPLDTIYVDNIGFMFVEEMQINFNGGYTGTIKGKRLPNSVFVAPEITDIRTEDYPSWYIRLRNNNIVAVTMKVNYSGGTLTYTIPANSDYELNNVNCPDLNQSVDLYNQDALQDTVIAWFEYGDLVSESEILLEENA